MDTLERYTKMYANLFINGERVSGIINSVAFKEDFFSSIKAIGEVHMDIANFNVRPKVKKVIYNDPATIIFWTDGTKTVVKCQEGDTYSKEKGFVMAYLKKMLGNDNTFNKEINKWVPKEEQRHTVVESYIYDELSDMYTFRDDLGNTILELPRELMPVMRVN